MRERDNRQVTARVFESRLSSGRRLLSSTSVLVLALSGGLVLPGAALAGDWTGAVSSDWFVTGNWSTGAVPTTSDVVHIGTVTPNTTWISGAAAFGSIVQVGTGNSGLGELTIAGGGTLTLTQYIDVASGDHSVATVTVTGAGSALNGGVIIDVGSGLNSNGTLNILNGATATDSSGYVGTNPTATGTVTVDGMGSTWTNTSNLGVGFNGTGILNIQNGGTVTSAIGILGFYAPSTGNIVNLDGVGSSLTSTTSLTVGNYGSGTVNVINGGTLGSGVGYLGLYGGSSGTVVVDGLNSTWAAGTELNAGVLGTGTLTVANGGAVTSGTGYLGFQAGSTGTASITGAGSTWTNTGDLTVGRSGTGTLSILNGGAVSSVQGIVGALAGSNGQVTVDGVGSTWSNSGDLHVGSFGAGKVTISNGAMITSANGTIGDQAGATGTVVVTGAGSTWTTGTVFVGGSGTGILNVSNGGVVDGLVTVLTGGKLGGNGRVGGIAVGPGGIVGPGNSIGTLNVNGNIGFLSGSIYQVEVNAAGQADRIVATGAAALTGGTVQVLAGAGSYALSTQYTILTAAGGVTGAFSNVTSNLAFLTPLLSYDADDVFLTLSRNATSFQDVGNTRNQKAAAAGAVGLGTGNVLHNAILQLDAPSARSAFDQLSGEVHASAKGVMIEDSKFVRDTALDRLRDAFNAVGAAGAPVMTYADGKPVTASADTDRIAFWVRGFGAWGSRDGDGNAAAVKRSIGGIFAGGDAHVTDNARLGMLGGYSRSTFKVGERQSSGSSDNYHLGLYGGTQWGSLAFRSGAVYSWHELGTSRSVAFPGFSDTLTATYSARTAQVFGELGYRLDAGSTPLGVLSFEPFANLAYVSLDTGSFREKGGAAALFGTGDTSGVTFTTLGLRAATQVALDSMPLTARGTLGWRHAFGDTTPLAFISFAGGSPFTVAGVPIAGDAAIVEAGLDLNLTPNAALGLSYAGQFGASLTDQSLKGTLQVRF